VSQAQYQPGICNIGGAEIAQRRNLARLGGALFFIYCALAVIKNYDLRQSALAIIPAMIFSIGFIQSRKKFCLAYGLMGTFNFQRTGQLTKVTDKASLVADRRTALAIIAQSIGLAIALTGVLLLINGLYPSGS
jgi:hypothetical protein